MKRLIKFLSPILILIGLYFIFRSKELVHPPGILAPNNPIQTKLDKKDSWDIEDYKFSPVANFELNARVLSIRFYGSDDMSEYSPVDIAVGWGKMSDQAIIDNLDINQQHRWYVWRTNKFPIPQKEIELSSSNIHIIPASQNIEDILDDISQGNIISLRGKLVNVKKSGQKWDWKTSTKRNDTGSGACEILWTENISIIK